MFLVTLQPVPVPSSVFHLDKRGFFLNTGGGTVYTVYVHKYPSTPPYEHSLHQQDPRGKNPIQ